MDPYPLVKDQIEAGRELVSRLLEIRSIEAAFWVNPTEEGYWKLHIVSERIKDSEDPTGYGAVIRISNEFDHPDFDPFQVKMVNSPNPLAAAIIELRNKHPEPKPIRLRGAYLGGVLMEDLYVYPAFVKTQMSRT